MIYYLYDGSFTGLLTSVYEAYYRRENPTKIIRNEDYTRNLFAEKFVVKADSIKAEKVYQAVKEKISAHSLKKVYYSYLSELEGVEITIYNYLKKGFKAGCKIDERLTDKDVLKIDKISNKVSREIHRLLGLIRFRKLKGEIYYAPVEPDYHLLVLLAPHFARRMADQNWIIHDLKRGEAVVYNQEEWILTPAAGVPGLNYAVDEENYQLLWKEFFHSVAIKGRKNLNLQRQFMPQRYWKHLIEKQEIPHILLNNKM